MGRQAEAHVRARYSIEGAVKGLAGAVQNVLGRNATSVSEGQTA